MNKFISLVVILSFVVIQYAFPQEDAEMKLLEQFHAISSEEMMTG